MTILLTVHELNTYLRELLSADELLADVWVQGEIATFKQASSGHCYFSVKEGNAVMRAVMWRNHATQLHQLPAQGDAVVVHGAVSFYETGGDVQLYADTIRSDGVGMLHAHVEALKTFLAAEGLFDAERKRPLPVFPRRVGVATSAQGAALHDISTVLARRCPLVEMVFAPCNVQGAHAADSIVHALYSLYEHAVDVIILARGGGSLEDLWCFNEERVARAVAASPVPVITGVGHETDTTMVDYVADVRAATPSVAAEIVVPPYDTCYDAVQLCHRRMVQSVAQAFASRANQLDDARMACQRHTPTTLLATHRQHLDEWQRRADSHKQHHMAKYRLQLQQTHARLHALNPFATLQRGYALLHQSHAHDGTPGAFVRSVTHMQPGDDIIITLHDGTVRVTVKEKIS